MAGTLVLNTTDLWMPSAGAFDGILEDIASELRDDDPELVGRIDEGLSSNNGFGYLSLADLPAERLGGFLRATQRYQDRQLAAPPASPGYWGRNRLVAQLEALLRLEPRVAAAEPEGELVLADDVSWRAPGWIFDLVLVHLAAKLAAVDTPAAADWARRVAGSRVRVGAGVADLRALPAQLVPALQTAQGFVHARLGGGEALDVVAPAFQAALVAPLAALHATFARAFAAS